MVQGKGADTVVNLSQAWAEALPDQSGKMVAVAVAERYASLALTDSGSGPSSSHSRQVRRAKAG